METQFTSLPHIRFLRDLLAVALCIALMAVTASAEESTGDRQSMPDDSVSTRVEDSARNGEATPEDKVSTSTGYTKAYTVRGKHHSFMAPVAAKTRVQAAQSPTYDFEIYDAIVTLYYDDDHDGHYYGIDVTFDADTVYSVADVFARLYLSLNGGPWEHYYTTEIFTLLGNSPDDFYTVETELYSGYPTGSYDVLIELYDAGYGDFLTDFGPDKSDELYDLPLEDQQKDSSFLPPPIVSLSSGSGGAGSTSAVLLALLTLVLLSRRHKDSIKDTATSVSPRHPAV